MKRIRGWFGQRQVYQALDDDPDNPSSGGARARTSRGSSKFEYGVFLLVGCAMLWSWNMFMACATYFQRRFADNDFLLNNFQSLILASATFTNVGAAWFLSYRQTQANYPARIWMSLLMNIVLTTTLALSTIFFIVGPESYIFIVLGCVLVSGWSTGLTQNGVFAFVNTFGSSCMQAVMTGQGIAGVLPSIAQIASVLLFPSDGDHTTSPKSAFIYFFTATFVSGACLLFFLTLLASHHPSHINKADSEAETENLTAPLETPTTPKLHKNVSLWILLSKLRYLAFSVWFSFCITMVFPVFTQAIVSVRPLDSHPSRFFTPDVFIPFSFLIWNLGDLSGRIICGFDQFRLTQPRLLALFALARVAFIPLYFMCNVKGDGAVINSDLFYWVVSFTFGLSSGWVGSNALMTAPGCVNEDEREASGGFMGLCLTVGLAVGSLASFLILGA